MYQPVYWKLKDVGNWELKGIISAKEVYTQTNWFSKFSWSQMSTRYRETLEKPDQYCSEGGECQKGLKEVTFGLNLSDTSEHSALHLLENH